MALVMKRVRHLPAYGGALSLALTQELQPVQQSTAYAQPVDNDDTPPEVIAAKMAAALAQQFPEHAAGGIEFVSDTEMLRMVKSNG